MVIWSDESLFTVQTVTSSENERVYVAHHSEIPEGSQMHSRRQNPSSETVWASVASDGSKCPLVFMDKRVKFNRAVNIKIIENDMISWVRENIWRPLFLHRRWCSSSHFKYLSKVVQRPFQRFLWPGQVAFFKLIPEGIGLRHMVSHWDERLKSVVQQCTDSESPFYQSLVHYRKGSSAALLCVTSIMIEGCVTRNGLSYWIIDQYYH